MGILWIWLVLFMFWIPLAFVTDDKAPSLEGWLNDLEDTHSVRLDR